MTNNQPFFTAIIPTFNRWPMLSEAIESVLNQTFKDYELIIVDDGSTDDTARGVVEIHPDIKLVTKENGGVSSARNAGIQSATGKWLAFLDSDDMWTSEKLERQFAYIKKHPKAKVVHCDEIWWRGGRRVNPGTKHRKAASGGETMDRAFERSLEICLISPSSVVINREVFEAVGLFDESLPACEDYDLWLRIMTRFSIHHMNQELSIKRNADSQNHGANQLSSSIWGQDRYRVASLEKLIADSTTPAHWRDLALVQLIRKADILAKGSAKRDKSEEAKHWRKKSTAAKALVEEAS